MNENKYERQKLYEEVWGEPVAQVARRYGVSDVTIHKTCKKLNIPVPPRGYWAKLRAGKKTQKEPLPKFAGPTVVYGSRSYNEGTVSLSKRSRNPLLFLPEDERQRILGICQSVDVKEQLLRPHRLITEHRDELVARRKRERERRRYDSGSFGSYDSRSRWNEYMSILDIEVSRDQLNRAYRILDAFIGTLETLSGSVVIDKSDRRSYALVGNERVQIRMIERSRRIPHELTAQEEARLKKDQHFSPPTYDTVYTGELQLQLLYGYSSKRVFRDTEKRPLEAAIGDALVMLLETAEGLRIAREAREAEERRREEERLRRLRKAEAQRDELQRVSALKNRAMDWHIANEIRAYIAAVEGSLDGISDPEMLEERKRWIQWAREKADWLDPTVAAVDSLLGVRDHSADEGKKVRIEDPYSYR